jgi:hypothetical protein
MVRYVTCLILSFIWTLIHITVIVSTFRGVAHEVLLSQIVSVSWVVVQLFTFHWFRREIKLVFEDGLSTEIIAIISILFLLGLIFSRFFFGEGELREKIGTNLYVAITLLEAGIVPVVLWGRYRNRDQIEKIKAWFLALMCCPMSALPLLVMRIGRFLR